MARRRKGLAIDGVVILDKPQGVTSNTALQRVRGCLNARKAGHTGALDPLATGVLPLCFGEATKFSQILLEADKEYLTTARLGQKTASADADSEIIEEHPVPEDLDVSGLEAVLSHFRGEISQVPSMYSALKHKGVPLYKLARKGQEVEREARQVQIYELELLELKLPYMSLRVKCSKGTYIRNLVEDIGDRLGCGAHVTMLRRTQSGPFRLDQAQPWSIFEAGEALSAEQYQAFLLPADTAVADYPKIILNQADAGSIIRGQTVKISPPDIPVPVDPANSVATQFRLYRENDNVFMGIGEVDAGELKSVRLLSTDVLSEGL